MFKIIEGDFKNQEYGTENYLNELANALYFREWERGLILVNQIM